MLTACWCRGNGEEDAKANAVVCLGCRCCIDLAMVVVRIGLPKGVCCGGGGGVWEKNKGEEGGGWGAVLFCQGLLSVLEMCLPPFYKLVPCEERAE